IEREARAQGKPLAAHYAHMVVHAMLHLRGHDHVRRDAARRMERIERRTLAQLGVADPYAVESARPRR
ncbi:MAG: rRNA maturation RNase YbeY, partial [Proteobacteria bacterium]|nr:rRNA maturation RNase YbeY [Pseudomonadota bacterium]